MTTVLTVNIDDLDTKFVEDLKRDFAHAAAEIRLQEQPDSAASFTMYIPVYLTPLFRFHLTPLFRSFDPLNVGNIPKV